MKVDDNVFPKLIIVETAVPANPASGDQALYIDPADHLPKLVNSSGTVSPLGGGGSGLYRAYICIQDQKAQNTAGGTFTAGAWQTRNLTTKTDDTSSNATLASNQITLLAGTYRAQASAPAYYVNMHQIRLQNITDAATLLVGTSEFSNNDTPDTAITRSLLTGRFTISSTKVIELQHHCTTTKATNGLGLPGNFTTEVYAVIELWKE